MAAACCFPFQNVKKKGRDLPSPRTLRVVKPPPDLLPCRLSPERTAGANRGGAARLFRPWRIRGSIRRRGAEDGRSETWQVVA